MCVFNKLFLAIIIYAICSKHILGTSNSVLNKRDSSESSSSSRLYDSISDRFEVSAINRIINLSFRKYQELGLQRYLSFLETCTLNLDPNHQQIAEQTTYKREAWVTYDTDIVLYDYKANSETFEFLLSNTTPEQLKQISELQVEHDGLLQEMGRNKETAPMLYSFYLDYNDTTISDPVIPGDQYIYRILERCLKEDCLEYETIYIIKNSNNDTIDLDKTLKGDLNRIGFFELVPKYDIFGYIRLKDLAKFLVNSSYPKDMRYIIPIEILFDSFRTFARTKIGRGRKRMEFCYNYFLDIENDLQTMTYDAFENVLSEIREYKEMFKSSEVC